MSVVNTLVNLFCLSVLFFVLGRRGLFAPAPSQKQGAITDRGPLPIEQKVDMGQNSYPGPGAPVKHYPGRAWRELAPEKDPAAWRLC